MKKKMSPNSLANLNPIKKGEVRNPKGGAAHNPEIRALKKFTTAYLQELIEMAVLGNLAGLKTVVDNPNSPAIQVGVAKSLHTAISNGDWGTLERIVERIIGKIPDRLEVKSQAVDEIEITFVSPNKNG